MRAQDRKVYYDGNSVMPCPSCGSKKKIRWHYRDMVLAVLHWPARGDCVGCQWNYQDHLPLHAPGEGRFSWGVMTRGLT